MYFYHFQNNVLLHQLIINMFLIRNLDKNKVDNVHTYQSTKHFQVENFNKYKNVIIRAYLNVKKGIKYDSGSQDFTAG